MKRKSKLFLIVAGIMTALGVLVCLVGYFVSLRSGERAALTTARDILNFSAQPSLIK